MHHISRSSITHHSLVSGVPRGAAAVPLLPVCGQCYTYDQALRERKVKNKTVLHRYLCAEKVERKHRQRQEYFIVYI